jgi:hypothetical protein
MMLEQQSTTVSVASTQASSQQRTINHCHSASLTTNMETSAPTIGMRLDSLVSAVDSIPLTYRAFVIICCAFAYTLLKEGSGGPNVTNAQVDYQIRKITSDPVKKVSKRLDTNEPQPKWHILKLCNIAAVIGLLTSFFQFASNASTYLNDSSSLLKFLAIWSTCLCYFFGFFGISFIDADELERGELLEPEQQQQQQHLMPRKR